MRAILKTALYGLLLTIVSLGAAEAATCPAAISPPKVSLTLDLGDVRYDNSRDSAGLERIQARVNGQAINAGHGHAVPIGLTVASTEYGYRFAYKIRRLGDGTQCVYLSELEAKVGYKDMAVYIDNSYAKGSCAYERILEHEQKHVAINREVLKAYEPRFVASLRQAAKDAGVVRLPVGVDPRVVLDKRVLDNFRPIMGDYTRARTRANMPLDTRDSYRKVRAACAAW